MFNTEIGRAFIMTMVGHAIVQLPMLAKNTKAQRIAKECRVSGLTVAGNTLINNVVEMLGPELLTLFNTLPEPEKLRVVSAPVVKEVEAEIEEVNEKKLSVVS
jgi:hypothetical protein